VRVLINNGAGDIDYTRYVEDGSLTVDDSINIPTLTSFVLAPSDSSFVVPKRSSYIKVTSDIYAPAGGYGSGKILATGFITAEPERTFLGLNERLGKFSFHQYAYGINVTSDEWILNSKTVPYIPAFVNQTDSQILAQIANTLMPGFFDTTSQMSSGTLIPYFQYDPAQTWSDIAKTFADQNRYHYKVKNRIIYYQPFGDKPLGIIYDDQTMKGKNLFPAQLVTQVVTVPPVNDCIVIGDVEPQMNCEDYFIGDGFTSNFQLRHQVFDGTTANLLQDDWTEAQFAQGTWIEQDPLNVIELADGSGNAIGALNVIQAGAPGVYTPQTAATFVQAQNGLELGGGINIQSGQVTFNDASNGLIGALFSQNTSFAAGNCLAGFGITGVAGVPVITSASGASGIGIQPIYNGAFIGPQVITKQNHQYVLQMWIGAQSKTRYTRPFTNLTQTATYGDEDLTATGTITFLITDVDLGQYVIEQQNPLFGLFPAAPPPVVTKYMVKDVVLPPFVVYCLLNGINLNVSINYTDISLPPQGFLTVQSLTGASGGQLPWHTEELTVPITYQLGFAQQNQTAQISQQGEANELAFYTDDIPSVGARIRLQSWSAGQSIARVRDPIAIASEAAISGDDGVRSAIMSNISPLPRTSDECEAAAAATILDREFPQFQGTYTVQTDPYKFENLFSPSIYDYPVAGRFLYVRSPLRGVSGQNYFLNAVRMDVLDLREEILTINVSYGPDTYLERLLPSFLERETGILAPTQSVKPPNPVFISEVLNAHLPTLDNAKMTLLVNSLTGNYIQIDLGQLPVTGCEVRNVDNGWGVSNQGRVGFFTSQVFTLPRTSRDQTWYLRQVNGSFFSRFSKKIRVAYPLIPSPPGFDPNVDLSNQNLTLHLSGDVRDIYGVELRLPGVSGTFILDFPAIPNPISPGISYPAQNVSWFNRVDRPLGSTVFNVQANIAQSVNSSGAVSIRPTVLLNGWGPNGHVGAYELGTDQAYNWGLDGGTTDAYTNPTLAYDGDPNSKASIVVQSSHQYAGCVWTFGTATPGSPSNFYSLNILSEVPANGEDGNTITVRSAGIWYSLDAGSSWQQIYNQGPRTKRWDTVVLPVGQNLNNVQVLAFMDSHDDMAHYVFEINIAAVPYFQFGTGDVVRVVNNVDGSFNGVRVLTGVSTSQAPGIPGQFEETLTWFDVGEPFPIQSGTQLGTSTVGSIVVQSRDLWATLLTASLQGGVATIRTAQPHGFSPGDLVTVGAGFSSLPAGKTYIDDAAFYTGTWGILAVPDVNTFQFALPGRADWAIANIVGVVARVQANAFGAAGATGSSISLSTNGTLVQRPVFAPSDLVFDLTQPDVQNVLEVASALQSVSGGGAEIAAYFFNLMWDYSAPTLLFDVGLPVISGLIIDTPSQQAKWTVTAGRPTGYRVEVTDPTTGKIVNKFTTDHPHNLQALTQFQMSMPDFNNPRVIAVTPFNALGDGITKVVSNASSLLFNPNVISGQNLYDGNCFTDGIANVARNLTFVTVLASGELLTPWARFKAVLNFAAAAGNGPATIGNMVLLTTLRNSSAVIASTPVTIGGTSAPVLTIPSAFTAGRQMEIYTDVINVQLDWDHDYYLLIWFTDIAINTAFNYGNCGTVTGLPTFTAANNLTGNTTIPNPGGGMTGRTGQLVSRIVAA
jgi:hypothetical protein